MQLDDEQKSTETEESNKRRDSRKAILVWVVIAMACVIFIYFYVGLPWIDSTPQMVAKAPPPLSRAAVTTVAVSPGKVVVATGDRAVIARDPNTSDDCPGKLSKLEELSEDRVDDFNPRGCRFYARGTGPVAFSGLFVGEIERDISKAWDTGARIVYSARAAKGTVKWRYILCAGPKTNLQKDDCS